VAAHEPPAQAAPEPGVAPEGQRRPRRLGAVQPLALPGGLGGGLVPAGHHPLVGRQAGPGVAQRGRDPGGLLQLGARVLGALEPLPQLLAALQRLLELEEARLQAVELVLDLLRRARLLQLDLELGRLLPGLLGGERLALAHLGRRERRRAALPRGQIGGGEGQERREPRRGRDAGGLLQVGGDLREILRHQGEGALLGVEPVELAARREVADDPVGDAVVAGEGQAGPHGRAARSRGGARKGLEVAGGRVEQRLEQAAQRRAVGGHDVVAGPQARAASRGRDTADTLRCELEEDHGRATIVSPAPRSGKPRQAWGAGAAAATAPSVPPSSWWRRAALPWSWRR
jgi:hypothetical protein